MGLLLHLVQLSWLQGTDDVPDTRIVGHQSFMLNRCFHCVLTQAHQHSSFSGPGQIKMSYMSGSHSAN